MGAAALGAKRTAAEGTPLAATATTLGGKPATGCTKLAGGAFAPAARGRSPAAGAP